MGREAAWRRTRSPWRKGVLPAFLCGLAMLFLASAASATPEALSSSGSLTYTWQASPALGCAQANLCGVHGAVSVTSLGGAYVYRAHQLMLEPNNVTARTEGPGQTTSCADIVQMEILNLQTSRRSAHYAGDSAVPSAGRCAGPLQGDIERLAIPLRRTAGAHPSFLLHGDVSTSAGPFVLRLSATMTLRPGGGAGLLGGFGEGGAPPSPLRAEQAVLSYAVAPSADPLIAHFQTAPSPFCESLGSCGTSGTIAVSLLRAQRPLKLILFRPVAHHVGRAQALRDLRAGRLTGGGSVYVPVTVTEAIDGAGGAPSCRSQRTEIMQLYAVAEHKRRERLLLFGDTSFASLGNGGVLRTYCPGPDDADMLNEIELIAQGSLPQTELGSQTLTPSLAHTGGFRTAQYAGGWSGALGFPLELTGVSAGTKTLPPLPIRVLPK
jgi:hypothetical protein